MSDARRLHRRQLLWQGLVGAGVLAVGPAVLRAASTPVADLGRLQLAAASVAPPPIVTRAQWGADESLRGGRPDFAPLNRAIVHHTVTANHEPDPAARVRAIYEYHVRGNRWSDIGYNFLVDPSGRIYEGRSAGGGGPFGEDGSGRSVIGAHAEGHNTGSVGIALLGTYSGAAVVPTGPALEAVAALVAWKFGTRGIDPTGAGALIGHRDVVSTGCPGEGLYRRLAELRLAAAARIAAASRPADDDDGDGDGDGDGGIVEELLDPVGGLLG